MPSTIEMDRSQEGFIIPVSVASVQRLVRDTVEQYIRDHKLVSGDVTHWDYRTTRSSVDAIAGQLINRINSDGNR